MRLDRSAAQGPKIVVIGSFIMDLVVSVEKAPADGETVIGKSFGRYPGGKGANQAVAAARLGAQVAMVGKLGTDLFGEDQRASLSSAGVDLQAVASDKDNPSGVASIVVDAQGHNRIAIVPGANHCVTVEEIEAARPLISAADYVLVQLELPLETTIRAMEIANEVDTPVIFNPAPARPLHPSLLRKAAVITPNEVEAAQLAGVAPSSSIENAQIAGERLVAAGAPAVVITLGEQGALVMQAQENTKPQATLISPYAVQAVDTVAAGDCFNGALAVRLGEGASLVEAAQFATAAAAISVTQPGAQPSMPSRSAVEGFMKTHSPRPS